jgi:hypothetical protein
MGSVSIHNEVAANITVKLKGPNSPETTAKCSYNQTIHLDLAKMEGWAKGDEIQISVHADGGATRHNHSGEYQADHNYQYKVTGTLTAFAVNGPL